jgi:hypothetical protein
MVDTLDYLLTLVWLRILDALAGPQPETPADQQRKRGQIRTERTFSKIEPSEPAGAISRRMDRVPSDD